ncbi:hypothetical protein CONLIGDRAFT_293606 [Coniochaeta ligniaria NRRL 30616]|uniref:Zn(2)-C6 fungal-type domain-containing protein n=1 Tax=Coniochaeta ligniaria NRRL 30616 TaxID=1408157 RepID=A0A1J7IUA8_9PEZI|nr:hypothetical protein CONLIGDRAFT_293606 [Coniochaeta ligniaria NRRL 30616]
MRGCWTCKARRKKCDGSRPSCHECNRLRLDCKGYQQRPLIWEDDEIRDGMRRRGWRRKHKTNSDGAVQSTRGDAPDRLSAGVRCISPTVAPEGSLSSSEVQLLGWYVQRFAVSYPSFNHGQNPFLSCMLPMAFHTPCLMKAMLAVAGTQACHQQPQLRPVTLQCRIGALRGLRTHLSPDLQTGDIKDMAGALACALMLFIYEKIECEENALGSHLSYAASLVARLLPSYQHLDGDVRFLVRLFIHNDIYASFALRTRPALDCMPASTLSATVLQGNTFLGMLASISRLAASPNSPLEEVLELSDALHLWQPSMDWLPSSISPREQTAAMVTAGEVHRRAAMTAFERSIGLSPDMPAIHAALDSLPTIPAEDPITASLLWPTVVLGAEVADESRRQALRARLQTLADQTGYKQYTRAMRLLGDCWAAASAAATTEVDDSNVSWVDVMHVTGNFLLCTL